MHGNSQPVISLWAKLKDCYLYIALDVDLENRRLRGNIDKTAIELASKTPIKPLITSPYGRSNKRILIWQ
jgi:hypothetical protein